MILCILAVLSTTASNCLREAYIFDIRIFFNDRGTELRSGGKDTDMTCATKYLWHNDDRIRLYIGNAHIFHWEYLFNGGYTRVLIALRTFT